MLRVEPAKISDAAQMHRLINYFADRGEMLPRALSEIYENIRDYFVVRGDDKVIACAALHVYWIDLGEIRSVTVSEESHRHGVGSMVVKECLEEAKRLGIASVFCLSSQPAFFEKLGFERIDVMKLNRKVWAECYRCPKFPNCDEIALVYRFDRNSPIPKGNETGEIGKIRIFDK